MKALRFAILFSLLPLFAFAQSNAPYTDGPVWELTLVRTKHGMGDTYLKSISKTFKAVMEAAKKEGIILDYKVLYGIASSPEDFNVLLMVQTKNMAYRDVARERLDPIVTKIEGDTAKQHATTGARLEMREVLGEKLMREVYLK